MLSLALPGLLTTRPDSETDTIGSDLREDGGMSHFLLELTSMLPRAKRRGQISNTEHPATGLSRKLPPEIYEQIATRAAR